MCHPSVCLLHPFALHPFPCALGIPDDPLSFGGGSVSEHSKLVIAGVRSIRVPVCGLHGEEVERPGTESESPVPEQHAGNLPQRGLTG